MSEGIRGSWGVSPLGTPLSPLLLRHQVCCAWRGYFPAVQQVRPTMMVPESQQLMGAAQVMHGRMSTLCLLVTEGLS